MTHNIVSNASENIDSFPWRRCPTYGRDIASYCYLRLCTLCRSPWLSNSGVVLNVCSVACLVFADHFKGSYVFFFTLHNQDLHPTINTRAIEPAAKLKFFFAMTMHSEY